MGVRAVVADWGTKDPAIADLLDRLQGSRQIPFLAVFPAGKPEKVITFSGIYTQSQLIDALRKAGPSRDVAGGPDLVQTHPEDPKVASKLQP